MKKGFTLAEILITLAIIGVVATLTIPGTIQNYRNKVLMTQLQNTINLVKTAVASAMEDSAAERFSSINRQNFLEKYFDTVNTCSYDDDSGDSSFKNCLAEVYTSFDKTKSATGYNMVYFGPSDAICAVTTSGATICLDSGEFESAGLFLIDVNGLESPNVAGKDLFSFGINPSGKLLYTEAEYAFQYGDDQNQLNSDKQSAASGATCTTNSLGSTWCLPYIISHGWTFKF